MQGLRAYADIHACGTSIFDSYPHALTDVALQVHVHALAARRISRACHTPYHGTGSLPSNSGREAHLRISQGRDALGVTTNH